MAFPFSLFFPKRKPGGRGLGEGEAAKTPPSSILFLSLPHAGMYSPHPWGRGRRREAGLGGETLTLPQGRKVPLLNISLSEEHNACLPYGHVYLPVHTLLLYTIICLVVENTLSFFIFH